MYFDNFKTLEEVKDRYRILAKKLHPDIGGDKIVMQEINLEYEKAVEKFITDFRSFGGKHNDEDDKELHAYIQDLNMVKAWAKENTFFKMSFINSLDRWLSAGKKLTDKQKESLENIIENFEIRKWKKC